MSAEGGHAEDIYEGASQERAFDFFAEMVAANAKRTYDAYQDLDLARARSELAHAERLNVLAENDIIQLQTHQADLNAQKIRTIEVAVENQWESSAEVSGEAVIAALAAAVAKTLNADTP